MNASSALPPYWKIQSAIYMANVNLSASFLVLLAGEVIILQPGCFVGGEGRGWCIRQELGKIINVGIKSHAMVRRHAHPEKPKL